MTKRQPVVEYVADGDKSFYRVLAGNGQTMLTSKAKRAALTAAAALGGLVVREGQNKA